MAFFSDDPPKTPEQLAKMTSDQLLALFRRLDDEGATVAMKRLRLELILKIHRILGHAKIQEISDKCGTHGGGRGACSEGLVALVILATEFDFDASTVRLISQNSQWMRPLSLRRAKLLLGAAREIRRSPKMADSGDELFEALESINSFFRLGNRS